MSLRTGEEISWMVDDNIINYRICESAERRKKSCCYCDVVGSSTRNIPITNTHDTTTFESLCDFFFFFFLSEGRVRSQTALLTEKQLEIHSPEPAAVTSPQRYPGGGAKFYARLFLCCCCVFQTRSDRVSVERKLLQTRLVFTLKGEMWRAASVAAVLRRRGHWSKVWGGICAPTWLCNSPRAVRGAGSTRARGTHTATRQEKHSSNWNWTSARGRTDRDYTTAHSPLLNSLQQEKTPFLSIHAHPHICSGEQASEETRKQFPWSLMTGDSWRTMRPALMNHPGWEWYFIFQQAVNPIRTCWMFRRLCTGHDISW